jgi:uncharacterized membrane protein YdbT with pleckstrin-like domain
MSQLALTYRCPHCGTPTEVDANLEGETVMCPAPSCGKPFKVEAPVARQLPPIAALADPAVAGEGRPLTVTERAADHEEVVAEIRLRMFRRYPFRCIGFCLIGMAGLVVVVLGLIYGSVVLALIGGAALCFASFRLLAWYLRTRSTLFTITNKRCTLTTGILREQKSEMLIEKISGVQIVQDMWARLVNIGDLIVSSSEGESRQLILLGVPDPKPVAALLHKPEATA